MGEPRTENGEGAGTQQGGIWAGVFYRDAPAGIDFLVSAFGFQRAIVVRGEDGREVSHAELVWPEGGRVMPGSLPAEDDPIYRPPGSAVLYVVTERVREVHDRAVAAGARIVRELEQAQSYDSLGFTALDPEGNSWSFGTYAGA